VKNSLLDVRTPKHETMLLCRYIGRRLPIDADRSQKNGDPNCAVATGTMADCQILNKDSDFLGHTISTAVI
jgi:hypothetical protein